MKGLLAVALAAGTLYVFWVTYKYIKIFWERRSNNNNQNKSNEK